VDCGRHVRDRLARPSARLVGLVRYPAGLPTRHRSAARRSPTWVLFHGQVCPPRQRSSFSKAPAAGGVPANEALHCVRPADQMQGHPEAGAAFAKYNCLTTRCEFDSSRSLIMSSAPISSGGRTRQAPAQKDGIEPDIQRDRATRSCGRFAVTQKGWSCAKGGKERGGVERLGNMFSLPPEDINGL
jgi:hypothetical protein